MPMNTWMHGRCDGESKANRCSGRKELMKGGRNSVHQQGFGAYTFINEAESEGFCEKYFCDFIISSQERRLFWG